MIRLNYSVIYPKVDRSAHPEAERQIIGNLSLPSDSIPRLDVCDVLFGGFGNHPGNEMDRGFPGYSFTTGDPVMDQAHKRWSNYRTRSMSVGDVVHFENSDVYYICDSCGWLMVNETLARKWLAYPREYGCSSFELNKFKRENALGQFGITAGGCQ